MPQINLNLETSNNNYLNPQKIAKSGYSHYQEAR